MSTITRILWLFVGLCAGIIDIGATWMSDLKEGICAEAFWLNREQCCWSVSNTDANDDYCQQVNAGINQILYSRSTRIHGGSIFLDFFAPPYTRINILNELWTCISSLMIIHVYPPKYVLMNLEKKIDNPKFAYMNLNDSTVCTMTNTNYLLVPFSCICSYAIY